MIRPLRRAHGAAMALLAVLLPLLLALALGWRAAPALQHPWVLEDVP